MMRKRLSVYVHPSVPSVRQATPASRMFSAFVFLGVRNSRDYSFGSFVIDEKKKLPDERVPSSVS